MAFESFWSLRYVLSSQAREAGLQICEAVFGDQDQGRSAFQMGKTKIFLRCVCEDEAPKSGDGYLWLPLMMISKHE